MRKCSTKQPAGVSKVESVADDRLGYQVIRGAGQAHADTKVNFPFWRKIQVNRRKYLVLLQPNRVEVRSRPDGTVVFNTPGNLLREVIAQLYIGRKNESLVNTGAMKGLVKRGVEREIP